MKQLIRIVLKAFAIHIVRRSTELKYKDVNYHTGFYRFSKYIDGNKPNFKVGAIPCLPQKGFNEFVFFTETNLVGRYGVIPVKKYYA